MGGAALITGGAALTGDAALITGGAALISGRAAMAVADAGPCGVCRARATRISAGRQVAGVREKKPFCVETSCGEAYDSLGFDPSTNVKSTLRNTAVVRCAAIVCVAVVATTGALASRAAVRDDLALAGPALANAIATLTTAVPPAPDVFVSEAGMPVALPLTMQMTAELPALPPPVCGAASCGEPLLRNSPDTRVVLLLLAGLLVVFRRPAAS